MDWKVFPSSTWSNWWTICSTPKTVPSLKILIDTDVLIDVALARPTFVSASLQVLTWAEQNPGQAAVAWHSLSNIAYLVKSDVRPFLKDLLQFVEVATVGTSEAVRAISIPISDFEDALQISSAISFHASWIVTRNTSHFKKSLIPTLSPEEFCKKHSSNT